jgi:hypothetical protein
LQAGNTITTIGDVSATDLTLQTTANNGGIAIGSNLGGSTTVTLTTNGSGNITRTAGTVSGGTIALSSTSGNIGTSVAANNIFTTAGTLTANTSGNVYVTETNAVNLGASGGATFNLQAGNTITTIGDVSATDLTLQTTANNGGIAIGSNLGGSTTVTLTTNGSGDITRTAGTVSGGTIALSSTSGNIGTSVAANNIFTTAGTLTANTSGNVYVTETNAVNLGASGGATFNLQAGNTITTIGDVSATDLTLQTTANNGGIAIGSNLGGSTTATLIAHGSGDITRTAGTVSGGTIALSSTSGNIGASAAANNVFTTATDITLNTSGNAYVTETDNMNLGASTIGSDLVLQAGGLVNINGVTSANNLNVTTTANDGNIVVGANATGATSVNFLTNGAGILTVNVGSTLSTSNGTIVATTGGVNIAGNIGAGSGSVTLRPNANLAIGFGDVADGNGNDHAFDINASELSNITAGTLIAGTTSRTGGFDLLNPINVSGVGPNGVYDLVFNNGGSYNSNGNSITLGTHSLTINMLGGVTSNVVSGGTGAISMTGNSITVNGAITASGAGTVNLTTYAGSGGAIGLAASVGGGATTTIDADGSGAITQSAGVVSGTFVNLVSDTGSIGTNLAEINTTAGTLTANSGAGASVYISETDGITVGASSAGSLWQLRAQGSINVTGALTANNVSISANAGSAGAIDIANVVTGTNSITLAADGNANVSTSGPGVVSGGTAYLSSGTGHLGTLVTSLKTNVDSLSVSTSGAGQINIEETNGINIIAVNASGDFAVQAGGNLSLNADLNLGNVSLTTTGASNGNIAVNNNIQAASILMTAGGSGAISQAASTEISAPTIDLASTTGDIGSASNPITITGFTTLSANTNAPGNVYIRSDNGLTLNPSTSGGEFNVVAPLSLFVSGLVNAGNVNFTTKQFTNVSTVTAAGTIAIQSQTGQGLNISGGGTLSAPGGITLNASSNGLVFSGDQTLDGNAFLFAINDGGFVQINSGIFVYGNNNVTVTTFDVYNQQNFIVAGTLKIILLPKPVQVGLPTPVVTTTTPTFNLTGFVSNDPTKAPLTPLDLNQRLAQWADNAELIMDDEDTESQPGIVVNNGFLLGANDEEGNSKRSREITNGGIISCSQLPVVDTGDSQLMDFIKILGDEPSVNVGKRHDLRLALISNDDTCPVMQVGSDRSDLLVYTQNSQSYFGNLGGSKNVLLSGTKGTTVSTNDNLLVLHNGHLLADSGSEAVTIVTGMASVTVSPDSTSIIDVIPGKSVRIQAIAGNSEGSSTVQTRSGLGSLITLQPGQELIVKDNGGMLKKAYRGAKFVPVAAQMRPASYSVKMNVFSIQDAMKNDPLLQGAVLSANGKSANNRMLAHVNLAAREQADILTASGLALTPTSDAPMPVARDFAKTLFAGKGSEPTRIIAQENAQFRVLDDGSIELFSGSAFISNANPTTVKTALGTVQAGKGGMALVTALEEGVRVKACTGPNSIAMVSGDKRVPLNPGNEVFVTDRKPSKAEALPEDGIGRRMLTAYALNEKLTMVLGDFSITSMINNEKYLSVLKSPVIGSDKQIAERLVRIAAIVHHITGGKGRYFTSPKRAAAIPQGLLKASRTSSNFSIFGDHGN